MSLEKRMYFFVPYQLTGIQKAIQAGHAALEYARNYRENGEFIDFLDNWKTWIILDGGTTNSNGKPGANFREDMEPYHGSLDNLAQQIIMNKVNYALFQEPDLNNALTAVCFIADERVFNYKDYPDFHEWILAQEIVDGPEKTASYTNVKFNTPEELKQIFPGMYPLWISFLGGAKNVFLRQLLKNKKLA